jgi:hypothetical protein
MTARERLLLIHGGGKRRRGIRGLAWSPLVNLATLEAYPPEIRGLGINGFVARVGGDIYNYYGRCWQERRDRTAILETPAADGAVRREYRTPIGSLFEVVHGQRVLSWRLKDVPDLRTAEYLVEDLAYLADSGPLEALERDIGDRGVAFPYLPASPVQELIQRYLGVEGFAYLLADHRDAVERLMRVMQGKNEELYRIAAASPSPFAVACENTSTRMISPAIFERYSVLHLASFADIMHARGKTAIAHMCGHIRDLLPLIARTRIDGINYVTPPPLGDTPWAEVFEVLGDDFIVDAAITPGLWMAPGTLEEVRRNVEAVVTDDLLDRNVMLTAGADGLPGIPIERFTAVTEALRPFVVS